MSEENLEFIGPIKHRECAKCFTYKPEDAFHNRKGTACGKQSLCKKCEYARTQDTRVRNCRKNANGVPYEDMKFIGPIPHVNCTKCLELFSLRDMPIQRGLACGRKSRCAACCSNSRQQWARSMAPKAIAARDKTRAEQSALLGTASAKASAKRKADPVYAMWNAARTRSERRGFEFTISPNDITWNTVCPILGLELIVGGEMGFDPIPVDSKASPSLDRIDSSMGYVPGNVCVISWRANKVKSNSTIEELEAVVKYMKDNQVKQADKA